MIKKAVLRKNEGFTLVEVIAAIILIGIMGSMVVGFFATALNDSSVILNRVKVAFKLNQVMARMLADSGASLPTSGTTGSQNDSYGSYDLIANSTTTLWVGSTQVTVRKVTVGSGDIKLPTFYID